MTGEPEQLALPERCTYCGEPLPANLVQCADAAGVTLAAYNTMRLAVPTALVAGIRLLASALPHLAGTCRQPRAAA